MTLYDQLNQRMKLFGLDTTFSIRIIDVDEDGEPARDESVAINNGQVTFSVTTDNSIATLNELVAKAKLGLEYGELLCTQRFNKEASKEQVSTFFNTIAPLVNSFAFREMMEHLENRSFTKEVMEWNGFLESLLAIDEPDHETMMSIISIYVTLVSNNVIEHHLPQALLRYTKPIDILLTLAKEPPSPELMCDASNQITGKTMTAMITESEDGIEMFHLDYSA